MTVPFVSGIFVYPIKSTAGVKLQSASIGTAGFALDRQWMVVRDKTKRFVSQREVPKMALIRPSVPEDLFQVERALTDSDAMILTAPDMPQLNLQLLASTSSITEASVWEWTGGASDAGDEAAEWFSSYLGMSTRLVRYVGKAAEASSPKISPVRLTANRTIDPKPHEESLSDLNRRLPAGMSDLSMDRFRPNIVVSGVEPWAEDAWKNLRLISTTGDRMTQFTSVKPCDRSSQKTETGLQSLETSAPGVHHGRQDDTVHFW
eukprot:gene24825-10475_t